MEKEEEKSMKRQGWGDVEGGGGREGNMRMEGGKGWYKRRGSAMEGEAESDEERWGGRARDGVGSRGRERERERDEGKAYEG